MTGGFEDTTDCVDGVFVDTDGNEAGVRDVAALVHELGMAVDVIRQTALEIQASVSPSPNWGTSKAWKLRDEAVMKNVAEVRTIDARSLSGWWRTPALRRRSRQR